MTWRNVLFTLWCGSVLVALLLAFGLFGCAVRGTDLSPEARYQQDLDDYNRRMETSPRFRCLAQAARGCEKAPTVREWSVCMGARRAACPADE